MMDQLRFHRYQKAVAVFLTLSSQWMGQIAAMHICQNGLETTHTSILNMNSSRISGHNGMCSCKIQVNDEARLSLYPHDLKNPGCRTSVSISDTSFKFNCVNDIIPFLSFYKDDKTAGDVLWLFVQSTGVLQDTLTGTLQIKTTPEFPVSTEFTLECFNPNTNTSETTSIPITTTTSPTTTTASTTQTTQGSITSTSSEAQGSSTMSKAAQTAPSVTTSSSDGQSVSIPGPGSVNSPHSVDTLKGDKENEFPVAAVAGGIAGGLLLILVVVLAVVCLRRRKREPNLLENGGPPSKNPGCENRAYDSGVPPIGEMKPQNTQPLDNETHVHVENDLYASADADNHQPLPQLGVMNNVPDLYASPEDLNIDTSDVESVEGSEIVITSSGDLYAVVDKSKKHQDHLVTDPDSTGPSADVYAVVNKKQDPQDIDTTHTVSPSGDVYAVVDKNNVMDPTDIDATHMVSPSGDVYAVVDKSMGAQEKDVPDMVSPSPFVLPEADPNDKMTRATIHDEEEEAIRRVMDMGDEREDSDTLQSTAL